VPAATYRGRSADVKLDIAIGHSGALEIELIQWIAGDSPHREFIERGREGMHHVQYRVEDADGWIAKLAPLGYQPIWYKQWCADTTFAYLERGGDPLIVEFLEMPPGGPGTRIPG
jgi:methylmalonyl-CoA/ethylmalonyl-CoA epimerase